MGDVSRKEQTRSARAGMGVRPIALLAVVPATGLCCFFELVRFPALHGLPWNQGEVLVVSSIGSVVGALLLAMASKSGMLKASWSEVLAGAASLFFVGAGALLAVVANAPEDLAFMGLCSVFLGGFGVPCVIYTWARFFACFDYRGTLLNSGLVYIATTTLLFGCMELLPRQPCSIWALAISLGGLAQLAFVVGKPRLKAFAAATPSSRRDCTENEAAPGRYFASVPFLGLVLYAFTMGVVAKEGGNPSWPLPVLFATYAAVGLLLMLLRTKLASLPDRQIVFLLQDLGLPAMAIIALAVKMIPLDAVAYGMFVEFMELFFHIIVLLAWVSVASCSYFGFARQPYFCAATAIAFNLFLVMGYLIGGKTSLFRAVVFGGLTALFLLYAVATAGRNLVLLNKSPETADELAKSALPDMDAVSASVAEEHGLSPRETEVLKELAYGHSSSYVAKVLVVSGNTVRTHMKNIYKKLGINSREDLLKLLRDRQKPAA